MKVLLAIWIITNIVGSIWELACFIGGDNDIIIETLLNDYWNWFGRIFLFILALVFFTIPIIFVVLVFGICSLICFLCER